MPDGREDVHFEGTFSESLVAMMELLIRSLLELLIQ